MNQPEAALPTTEVPAPPPGYEDDLSGYGPVAFDGYCGEPVAWGFRIQRHLGDERFDALRQYGSLECFDHKGGPGAWALVTKWLTLEGATEKYGAVTDIERGPRGGFRSVTYGTRKFVSRRLDPKDRE